MSGRCWTIEREGMRPPTLNKERSGGNRGGGGRFGRSRTTIEWRNFYRDQALALDIPHLMEIHVTATPLHKNRRSPQDVGACFPATKAAIDGLVDAFVVPDDSPEHLTSLTFRAPLVCGRDGLSLTIYEVIR